MHGLLAVGRGPAEDRPQRPAAAGREGSVLVVHLPEPELLDFALVPGSEGFISKSTAIPKLLDFARGGWQRQLLEQRVRDQALKFAADPPRRAGPLPDRPSAQRGRQDAHQDRRCRDAV